MCWQRAAFGVRSSADPGGDSGMSGRCLWGAGFAFQGPMLRVDSPYTVDANRLKRDGFGAGSGSTPQMVDRGGTF
jgi:hypothetical protein